MDPVAFIAGILFCHTFLASSNDSRCAGDIIPGHYGQVSCVIVDGTRTKNDMAELRTCILLLGTRLLIVVLDRVSLDLASQQPFPAGVPAPGDLARIS